MSPFFQTFLKLLQLEEGCRLTAYPDSRGVWTIGWGYNMVAHEYESDECEGVVWTQKRADRELVASLNRVLAALDANWPTWRSLDVVRQAVCVSGVYQLGSRKAKKFVSTIAALKAHDWESAARQLLKSKWATQTPERVHRNAVMLRTGIFPESINGQAFHPEGEAAAAVASAPIEPAAPVLPAQGLRHEQGASPAVGEKVGSVAAATPGLGTLIADVSKFLGKNPTSYGALGLFTMLVGNVRIQCKLWFFDRLYEFSDANILAALVAIVLILWGLLGKEFLARIGKAAIPCVLAGLLVLPGCVGIHPSGAGPEAAGLRADGPAVGETTEAPTKSTLSARLKAGGAWLWACVAKLRAMGVGDAALDALRADVLDVERLAKAGAEAAARELFDKAWATAVALKEGRR